MKVLYLVRHAKSSWKYNLEDHRRPLKKRGIEDVFLMCNSLKISILLPDLVLSSDAVRAKTTAELFIANLELNSIDFLLVKNLYDFSGNGLMNVIKSCNDSIDKLMVFGHNYAITNFVNAYGSKVIDNVPTCGYVEIHFEINSWEKLKKGVTVKTVFPKDLK
jgi:phosphohistidine phosphatase